MASPLVSFFFVAGSLYISSRKLSPGLRGCRTHKTQGDMSLAVRGCSVSEKLCIMPLQEIAVSVFQDLLRFLSFDREEISVDSPPLFFEELKS